MTWSDSSHLLGLFQRLLIVLFLFVSHWRLFLKNTNLHTEPKHNVFLSQLFLLFKFCHVCKADNAMVEASECETEAVVKTTCSVCKKENTWHSQPTMPESEIPAGNFLLCMAILVVGGGSASKVLQIFSHMGLGCVSLNKFFKYQRVSIGHIFSCM